VRRNSLAAFFCRGLLALGVANSALADSHWGPFIPPNYPWLRWSGRADVRSKVARFDWAQVSVSAEFEGQACAIYLDPLDNDFNVFVDGKLKAIFGPKPKSAFHPDLGLWQAPRKNGVKIWVLDSLGPGPHLLELNKRTGANFNIAKFFGLRLGSDGKLLQPPPPPARRLEFIGDSLTNAYGCEGDSGDCQDLRPFENSWKSYAALAARDLSADLQIIALSGYGVVRNYGDKKKASREPMPALYDRVISGDDEPHWDRDKFRPDAVVVNLGTNDFSTRPYPDPEAFQKGMASLLDEAVDGRGKIPVFVISTKESHLQQKSLGEAVQRARQRGLDATLVEFEAPGDDEQGCSEHPRAGVHQRWAATLEKALKTKMNW
jgi:hypothetical protein